MLRFGKKKETTGEIVGRLSSLSIQDGNAGERDSQVRLEDGSRVFCNPPSGHLPRSVLEEQHAAENPEYREFLRKKRNEQRRRMIEQLELKESRKKY